ncbi:hypothetical protein D3C72_2259440 [compost metagenome]
MASPVDARAAAASHLEGSSYVCQLQADLRIPRPRQGEQRLGLQRFSICARLLLGSKQFGQKNSAPISPAAKAEPTCRRPAAVDRIESKVNTHLVHLSQERLSK